MQVLFYIHLPQSKFEQWKENIIKSNERLGDMIAISLLIHI